jgi:hypothetical protein
LLLHIIGKLVEVRERQQMHPAGPAMSNIFPSPGIVVMVVLPGVFICDYTWSNVWDCLVGAKGDHLLQNMLRKLLNLFANALQKSDS